MPKKLTMSTETAYTILPLRIGIRISILIIIKLTKDIYTGVWNHLNVNFLIHSWWEHIINASKYCGRAESKEICGIEKTIMLAEPELREKWLNTEMSLSEVIFHMFQLMKQLTSRILILQLKNKAQWISAMLMF